MLEEMIKFLSVSVIAAFGWWLVGIQFHWAFTTTLGAWIVFTALIITTGKFNA